MQNSIRRFLEVQALWAFISLTACGQSAGGNIIGPPPPGPLLSWTASWVQGSQRGPIVFQAIGQTATLSAVAPAGNEQPPYHLRIAPSCVTASSTTMNTSVQITAATSGTCYIGVDASETSATVP